MQGPLIIKSTHSREVQNIEKIFSNASASQAALKEQKSRKEIYKTLEMIIITLFSCHHKKKVPLKKVRLSYPHAIYLYPSAILHNGIMLNKMRNRSILREKKWKELDVTAVHSVSTFHLLAELVFPFGLAKQPSVPFPL